MPDHPAVLLMSFGGPESLGEIPDFLRSLLGRTPPPGLEEEIVERYRKLGGGSPLPSVTRKQAAALEAWLSSSDRPCPVHVGMQHAQPSLASAIDHLEEADDLVAISLTPFHSQASTTAYEETISDLVHRLRPDVRLHFPADWHLHPTYIKALSSRLEHTLAEHPKAEGAPVIFSAHSLPRRFIEAGDPYRKELEETMAAVSEAVGGIDAHLAFQSRGAASKEPWIGPDVETTMAELRAAGHRSVVVDPIGFVSDHLETLYDNDTVHKERAFELGLTFVRVPCLNTDPLFIRALGELVLDTFARAEGAPAS